METKKTASKRAGATSRMPKATSGPRKAPTLSSARCTPNEVARLSRVEESEISASRGAVRIPLPIRSKATIAPIPPIELPAATSATLPNAEKPYPASATCLWRRKRSDMKPEATCTTAAAPR